MAGSEAEGLPQGEQEARTFLGSTQLLQRPSRRPGSREKGGDPTVKALPSPAQGQGPSASAGAEIMLTAKGQRPIRCGSYRQPEGIDSVLHWAVLPSYQ